MDDDIAAGRELRRLRQKYGLTLHEAAARLALSAPALSRRERGVEPIKREDIHSVLRAYPLTREEAYDIWMVAGFIPDAPHAGEHALPSDERLQAAAHLLRDLPLPAMILEVYGYIVLWTPEMEALWAPSRLHGSALHLIDMLLSPGAGTALADHADSFRAALLRRFVQRTLHLAHTPHFRHLLRDGRARYGNGFLDLWQRAHIEPGTNSAVPAVPTVQQPSAYGDIRYVLAQSTCYYPFSYELLTCVPADAQSLAR
ncbi:MAG: helix-turn-helix domain-containing protein [Blastochloris sp.]|nr:helix-turn-helix domain-containing protein [Blastochloris sp.]